MTKSEKELYIEKKIAFWYRDKMFRVEAIIKDISSFGILIEITRSSESFYEVGKRYLLPTQGTQFVYKFI